MGACVAPVILLVDDEADLVSILAEALRHELPNHTIQVATSFDQGEAVLDEIGADDLALLILDHALDGQTGVDFLQRNASRLEGVPRILYTGQAPQAAVEAAQQLQAEVLWKPTPLTEWLQAVQRALGR